MGYCIKCGAKLPDKAEFCNKCGKPIKPSDESKEDIKDKKSIEEQIEETAEEIGKKAEQIGKKIGKRAEQIGKRIEKKADDVGFYINQWFDNTFKIAGPLICTFIALIVLRVIIYFIQISGEDIFILTALGEGLHEYLLIIFVSMLLTNYNTYFYRKYKTQYNWIYPLISAVGFIIGIWIVAQIMLLISQSNNTPLIEAIGNFIDTYLIGIFILAIIIAYLAQYANENYISQRK